MSGSQNHRGNTPAFRVKTNSSSTPTVAKPAGSASWAASWAVMRAMSARFSVPSRPYTMPAAITKTAEATRFSSTYL